MTHDITTWAVTTDRDGAPMILAAQPSAEEAAAALALVRLNLAAKRYSVEPVGVTDHGFAARLAREAVAAAFQGGAEWTRVRPAELVPAAPPADAPQPEPERLDRGAVRPGHPAWAAEAAALLEVGYEDQEAREAARERLIPAALAGDWSIRELGHAILRERAEAADRTHVSALCVPDQRDPIALALGQDTTASVWARVQRAPAPGEVTNDQRIGSGGF